MNSCEQYQDSFVESLYGELTDDRKQELTVHLKSCSDCAREYERLSKTLSIMDQRQRAEPSLEYWKKFDEKLQSRIAGTNEKQPITFARDHSIAGSSNWWWKAAAAVLLVGFGIIIGKYYLAQPEPGQQQIVRQQPQTDTPVQNASMDPETKEFLERSEILLIGIVNLDTETDGAYVPEFSAQQKMSRDLIQEAAVLKTKLKGSDQRRLRRLVSDLELILLQIANLEASSDQPEIEIVKSGVDRKGMLLKINLEQMGMSEAVSEPERPASGKKRL